MAESEFTNPHPNYIDRAELTVGDQFRFSYHYDYAWKNREIYVDMNVTVVSIRGNLITLRLNHSQCFETPKYGRTGSTTTVHWYEWDRKNNRMLSEDTPCHILRFFKEQPEMV